MEPGATLQLSYRLLGGGGDGGSTGAESRSCYLEMYLGKKADKVNPEEERLARWTRCQLSGELLTPPCVVDELGNVFNKDALIQRLLDKSLPPALSHITGLRSVVEAKLQPSGTNGNKASSQVSFQPSNDCAFCCPISGLPLNGRYKFVLLRATGHVVSEKALKDVPAAVEDLAGGGKKLAELEAIPLNPTGEWLALPPRGACVRCRDGAPWVIHRDVTGRMRGGGVGEELLPQGAMCLPVAPPLFLRHTVM